MRRYRYLIMIAVLVLLMVPAAIAGWLQLRAGAGGPWTPSPSNMSSTATPAAVAALPTLEPPQVEPSQTPTEEPSPTAVPVAPADTPAPARPATATPEGPDKVIITEGQLAQEIRSGILSDNGLEATNLQIHFTGGKVQITADRLSYSFIQVDSFRMVGRLVAQDGALQLETESISPPGLATAMIPSLVNQSLRQYGEQWYVEQVHTSEGQAELTVR